MSGRRRTNGRWGRERRRGREQAEEDGVVPGEGVGRRRSGAGEGVGRRRSGAISDRRRGWQEELHERAVQPATWRAGRGGGTGAGGGSRRRRTERHRGREQEEEEGRTPWEGADGGGGTGGQWRSRAGGGRS
uniref:QSW5 n=2 Tax=Oryza sativa TaxID=4530 RepID=F8SPD1_ORYSJ|nr:qSW5 [Oryza sativa Indica Group]AEI87385.1 qSW5 [Oryza sativa Indica Group]AEI87386.1 qSW5 [Oryza sativa Japonica Group]